MDAERASGFLGPTEPRQRDDDEMSVASTASTFSAVSINPTAHAARRQGERDIETREVQRAKKEGRISLAIRFAGDEHSNKQATETAALEWGARVTAEFEGLQMGEVKTRGAPEDRRIEVEIRGSEKVAQSQGVAQERVLLCRPKTCAIRAATALERGARGCGGGSPVG